MIGCNSNSITKPEAMDMASAPADLAMAPDLSLPSRDPTDHPPLPQVDNLQGAVQAAQEVYTVVWQGDEALGVEVRDFLQVMLTSDYWSGSMAEYGIGKGKAMDVIVLPSAPPATIDDREFKTIVKTLIAAGQVGTVNPNTALAFIIPKTTKSTMQGGAGCTDYEGYHSETQTANNSGVYIPYMVNLRCGATPGLSEFDDLTDVLSHEAAEAATDAHPFTDPAWSNQTVPLGGEIGDLCVGLDTHITGGVDQGDAGVAQKTYLVQRLYSQKIAATGKSDPCIPAPSTPYFNVGINPDDVSITADASGNGSITVELEPFAFGNVGRIHWKIVTDYTPGVTFVPSAGTATAGETIGLNISVTKNTQSGQYPLLIIVNTDDGATNEWFGSLTVQ